MGKAEATRRVDELPLANLPAAVGENPPAGLKGKERLMPMAKRVMVLAGVLWLLCGGFAYASTLSLGGAVTMPWLAVAGVAENVGYEEVYYEGFGLPGQEGERKPITLLPGATAGQGLNLSWEAWIEPCALGRWFPGLRISRWGIGRTDSLEGLLFGTSCAEGEGGPTVQTQRNTVKMWGKEFYSEWFAALYERGRGYYASSEDPGSWREECERELFKYDPDAVSTSWSASIGFNASSTEALLEFPLTGKERESSLSLSLLAGARFVQWDEKLEQAVSGVIHEACEDTEWVYDYTSFGDPCGCWPDAATGYDRCEWVEMHNEYSAVAGSKLQFSGTGFQVGFLASVPAASNVRAKGKFTYSHVYGTANMTGLFNETFHIHSGKHHEWWVKDDEGNVIDEGSEDIEVSSQDIGREIPLDVAIPLSIGIAEAEVGIEAEFESKRLTVFVWAGYFGSSWRNVPLAPTYKYPAESWDVNRRVLVFTGGPAVKLGLRF